MKELLLNAIKNENISKLPDMGQKRALDLTGYRTRNIINNVCCDEKINYLEIGLYRGGTFSAALFKNKINAIGIDNWSQNWGPDNSKMEFFSRLNEVQEDNKVKIIQNDCWSVNLNEITEFLNGEKVNVYFFDGPHDYKDQYDALLYYYDILSDEFILFVDDYSSIKSPLVVKGTQDSIVHLGLTKIFDVELPAGADGNAYHEGLYAAVLKKK